MKEKESETEMLKDLNKGILKRYPKQKQKRTDVRKRKALRERDYIVGYERKTKQ